MRLRRYAGQLLESLGGLILAWMVWQLFFARERTFDALALGVAGAGLGAAWLRGTSVRTRIDVPIAIYVGLTALSALWHRGLPADPIATTDHTTAWRPLIIAAYLYGATVLLGSERKLGALVVALVVAISAIGAGASYDTVRGTVRGTPLLDYRTVAQWNAYAEVGLLLVVGFPLVVAALAIGRRAAVVAAAAVLTAVLLAFTWAIDARAPYVAMAGTFAGLTLMEIWWFWRFRLLTLAVVGALVLAAAFAVHGDWSSDVVQGFKDRFIARYAAHVRFNGTGFDTAFGRPTAWRPAAAMIRDHPWLGIGPGRYNVALLSGGYVPGPRIDFTHAHNLPLQVAAESGVPGALAFLAIWWSLLAGLRRRCGVTGRINLLAFALGGALVAYLIRNLGDHYTSGLFVTSDRIEFLLWTLFAAAAALIRLPRTALSGPIA